MKEDITGITAPMLTTSSSIEIRISNVRIKINIFSLKLINLIVFKRKFID